MQKKRIKNKKGIDKKRKRWYNIEVASEEPRKRLFRNEKSRKIQKSLKNLLTSRFECDIIYKLSREKTADDP